MATVTAPKPVTKHPRSHRLAALLHPRRKHGLRPGDPSPCHPGQALVEWPYNRERACVCPQGDHFYGRVA